MRLLMAIYAGGSGSFQEPCLRLQAVSTQSSGDAWALVQVAHTVDSIFLSLAFEALCETVAAMNWHG